MIARRVQQITPSGIRRFFDLMINMEGVISLGVGEPDIATPWHIREAAIYSLERGKTMYTSNAGLLELRREVSKYLEREYSLKYDPEKEILITVGVSEAMDLAARAILDPGDEVIIPDPCYVSYPPCVTLAGGTPIMVVTCQDENFEVGADAIEEKLTERTKAIIIGYPANPTGAIMPRQKLADIAELVARKNLLVISDEIYAKLTYGFEHTCFASLPGMKGRTVLLGGFSKSYAMTGWRIGYTAAPAEIIAAMTKIHQYTMLCAPIMSQMAALEAIKAGDDDVADMVDDYNRRRRVMVKGFNAIGLNCFEPKGAFYTFPSIETTGMTADEFAEKLLMEEKVAVVPGTAFGKCGEGHIRCCYATALDDIEEALVRIRRFVEAHK